MNAAYNRINALQGSVENENLLGPKLLNLSSTRSGFENR